jgi:hypothetical protein
LSLHCLCYDLEAIPAGLCNAENPPSSENIFCTISEEEWLISAALEENSAGIADDLVASIITLKY